MILSHSNHISSFLVLVQYEEFESQTITIKVEPAPDFQFAACSSNFLPFLLIISSKFEGPPQLVHLLPSVHPIEKVIVRWNIL